MSEEAAIVAHYSEEHQVDLHNNKVKKDWEKEWKDMPEFVQEKKDAFFKLTMKFRNEEDVQEFAKLIGQTITLKTKSLWYPKLILGLDSKKRWIDES